MPFPIGLALGGLSAVTGLLGQGGGYKYREPAPFSYSPDVGDPELLLRRRRALEESSRDRAGTVGEIGRAGLLGSSAAFDVLGEQESRGARTLEDIDADTFLKRRLEALQLYRDKVAFERQRALQGQAQSGQESLLGLGALGDIGGFLGGGLGGLFGGGGGLPTNALKEAANFTPELPSIRGRYL